MKYLNIPQSVDNTKHNISEFNHRLSHTFKELLHVLASATGLPKISTHGRMFRQFFPGLN